MPVRASLPTFGQGLNGGAPGDWADTAAVDGDRPPWSRAPRGARYQKIVTANQTEWYEKVKDDGRDDDWVLVDGIICQRILYSQFTDGGATAGTKALNGTIPVGAYLHKANVGSVTGFTGDTTATVIISGGVDVTTDTDGYMTGTPSVFTTADAVVVGVPSGVRTVTTAGIPVVTVTSGSDFTLVVAGAMTVTLFYRR